MRRIAVAAAVALLVACGGPESVPPTAPTATPPADPTISAPVPTPASPPSSGEPGSPLPATHEFTVSEHEKFDEPWALAFLPGTDTIAITERGGTLKLRDASGIREVNGVPDVTVGGQGGLGDLIAGPTFREDGTIYLSWVESGDGGTGAVVGRARLDVAQARLTDLERIWVQTPKVSGNGHFSHRLVIHDGHLYVSSGDRQKLDPAQEFDTTLGKILRLTLDGQPAEGNPFAGEDSPLAGQIWSYGHRNPLGLEFDSTGRLWSSEMGPQGGDELNEILAGHNYGWPEASNGSHYDGTDIPDHAAGDGFKAPLVSWTPSVSPGSLLIYQGSMFPAWRDDAFLGALSGEALIRVDLSSGEQEKWPMGARIRAVEEAPDGSIWLLEDGAAGRLLELRIAG